MTPIRYHEAAEEELLTEIAYLEFQARGLGRRFYEEVKRAEAFISQFPEASPEIRLNIRAKQVRKFRYSLIHSSEPNGLLILAVAHQSRRPAYWISRAGQPE